MTRHVIIVVTGQQGLTPASAAGAAEGVGLAPETPIELRAVVDVPVKVEQRRAAVSGGSCPERVKGLEKLAIAQVSSVLYVQK